MFGPKAGPNTKRGNLSKETENFLAGAMRANGTSKRAMEEILNQAGQGRLVTQAIPKTVREGSSAASHGVVAPRVGRRDYSLPVMPGSFSGRKMHDAIKRENPGRERYTGTCIAPGWVCRGNTSSIIITPVGICLALYELYIA